MTYINFDNNLKASFSFAVEEMIMNSKEFNDEYFLFWRTKPTLMIGKFQNTIAEINTNYVKENNIEIVRRNSGGGTIYTDEGGWQFSFISWKNNDFMQFIEPVLEALKQLGANVIFSGRNDILLDGKKISGNAQFSSKNRFLHHGSILFDTNINNMVSAITLSDDEKIISKGIKSIKERVTNLKPYLNKNLTSEGFRDELVRILSDKMDIIELTAAQIEQAKIIEQEKFLTWEWNYGKSPEFNITRSKRFSGGKIEAALNVKNGIIIDCEFAGDFFFFGDIEALYTKIIGCKYKKEDLLTLLSETSEAQKFINISVEELVFALCE